MSFAFDASEYLREWFTLRRIESFVCPCFLIFDVLGANLKRYKLNLQKILKAPDQDIKKPLLHQAHILERISL